LEIPTYSPTAASSTPHDRALCWGTSVGGSPFRYANISQDVAVFLEGACTIRFFNDG
jgi:hypothetical protein